MKVTHYDLFAGIGGFSYAIDQVYGKENTKHIFVEIDPFTTAVLKKHWPEGEYWGDIREFIANAISTISGGEIGAKIKDEKRRRSKIKSKSIQSQDRKTCSDYSQQGFTILTGGFPCQPFSQAGKRRGTQDNRFLWPEMFRAIQLIKPQWVIAENVYGLLTIEGGLVFEQVCADLEAEGYEIQTLIIPAVAVNAPHRRDRIWIVAYRKSRRNAGREQEGSGSGKPQEKIRNRNSNAPNTESGQSRKQTEQEGREDIGGTNTDVKNPIGKRRGGWGKDRRQILECRSTEIENARPSCQDWERNWKEVAFERCVCELDDGLSRRMVQLPGGTKISYAKWRQEGLKAFGNAIVPQVAIEILKAISTSEPN